MKRLWIYFVIMVAMAISASLLQAEQVHKLGVQFRTDFEFNGSNEEEDDNDETRGQRFRIHRAMILFKGTLNAKTNYVVAARLNSPFDRDSFDSTSRGMGSLYVDRQVTDILKLRIGKQGVAIGAWENSYSGMDQYFYSYLSDNLPSYSAVGLSVSLTLFKHQEFKLQFLNSPFKQNNQRVNKLNVNAGWYGSFFEGAVKPIVTMGSFPSSEQRDATGEPLRQGFTVFVFTSGVQFNFFDPQLSVDVESGRKTTPEYIEVTEEGQITIPEETITSVVLQVKYKPARWRPFVKFTSDDIRSDNEVYGGGSGVTGRVVIHTKYGFGIEHYPDTSVNTLRYHAVFTSSTEKPDEGFNVTYAQLNLGAAFRF